MSTLADCILNDVIQGSSRVDGLSRRFRFEKTFLYGRGCPNLDCGQVFDDFANGPKIGLRFLFNALQRQIGAQFKETGATTQQFF